MLCVTLKFIMLNVFFAEHRHAECHGAVKVPPDMLDRKMIVR